MKAYPAIIAQIFHDGVVGPAVLQAFKVVSHLQPQHLVISGVNSKSTHGNRFKFD
jgi:hypothetical protein